MPKYKAPLRDFRFVYNELFDGNEVATPDVVEAVLEEIGKIASEVLQPLNAVGDEEGCRLENGEVRTPKGFREEWALLREGGWMGLTGRPAYGGPGVAHCIGVGASE